MKKSLLITLLHFVEQSLLMKRISFLIFTESASTLIQSSSCNVHWKDEALKPLRYPSILLRVRGHDGNTS